MAALQSVSKCSRTIVYAPLLKRFAPCPRTLEKVLKPLLFKNFTIHLRILNHFLSRSFLTYLPLEYLAYLKLLNYISRINYILDDSCNFAIFETASFSFIDKKLSNGVEFHYEIPTD